ncbi:glycosyltransferase [Streptococcus tangpeifui]|uniref:glycosyltransferase n=1 Tax=Streptococcus tangpeifui TaxID=2709400 RepID=UPI0013ED99BE|nr:MULTISPECIES: glycosyltransferase [unclassified Streptococcus]
MKVLLYLEGEHLIGKSGIGRAIKHQQKALEMAGIPYTTDSKEDDYDIVHINTYGPKSLALLNSAKKQGKKVIVHGHSTMEDFRNSFIGSNLVAPVFKTYLKKIYQAADYIITPSEYSKSLIQNYGVTTPISAISNGIDLPKYQPSSAKEKAFRDYFEIKEGQKVVISAGLYFKRKGIFDFVKVAEKMPEVRFIWFGKINELVIPADIRKVVEKDHPANVLFPGYFKGDIFEGAMSGADAFFFPSYEETEGIVVLEALASHQSVVLRDIPVYKGWIDESSAELCHNNDEFITSLYRTINKEIDKRDAGYQVATTRSLENVSKQLAAVYQKVMEL